MFVTQTAKVKFSDATEIYVDIYKPDHSEHCFSGESKYPTFELRQESLIPINNPEIILTRAHVICLSRDIALSETVQNDLHNRGIQELVLFTTDMRYLVFWKVMQWEEAKPKPTRFVYVSGTGGLANCLYQVACAIHYCETYPNTELIATRSPNMLWGTAKQKDREQMVVDEEGLPVSYEHTIFSKIRFIDKVPATDTQFNNGYGGKHLQWNSGSHLFIKNYQQHAGLFVAHLNKLSNYLFLNDEKILHMLVTKYGNFKKCVIVGLRQGNDFRGKSPLTSASFNRALLQHFPGHRVLVVSDSKTVQKSVDGSELQSPYTMVNEPDIVQFHLARLCPNMIISASTFHIWMGYFIQDTFQENAKVVCFKHTDVTNRHLALPNWVQTNYWEGRGGPPSF